MARDATRRRRGKANGGIHWRPSWSGFVRNITCLRIRLATAHTQTNRNDNNAHHVLFVSAKLLIEKSESMRNIF